MPQGQDFRLYIANATNDDWLLIENFGDSTYERGKTAAVEVYKGNDQQAYISRSGQTITGQVGMTSPRSTAHARVEAVAASEEVIRVKYEDITNAGGFAVHGNARLTLGSQSDPTDGISSTEISVAFDQPPTEAVSPVAF
ncbi:MAG: hypothetical protein AAGD13_00600 [Pseudomonadota bacterium]